MNFSGTVGYVDGGGSFRAAKPSQEDNRKAGWDQHDGEKWPKVIRDLMADNKQAYAEWKEAGMPRSPHPIFVKKTRLKKKLMKMMRQYKSYEKEAQAGCFPNKLMEDWGMSK